MKIKLGIKLIILFVCTYFSFSQNNSKDFLLGLKYGLSLYTNYNWQAVDMRQLPSVADSVPRSASGESKGISFGTFYEYRLTDRTSLMFRALYTHHSSEITGNTPETLLLNGLDTLGISMHFISTNLTNAKLEPVIRYRLFSDFSLFGGLNAGVRFDNSFRHKESVNQPNGAVYSNGTTTRIGLDEELTKGIGWMASLILGFTYDIPINYNGTYIISPELVYEAGYSDITNKLTWDINTVRAGVSFKYSKNPTIVPEIEEIIEHRDSINTINVEISEKEMEYIKNGQEFITRDSVIKDNEIIITETLIRTDTLFYPKKAKLDESTLSEKENLSKKANTNKNCLKVYSMSYDGQNENPNAELSVEEFLSTSIQPLLNYIFFEHNSSILPSRYEMLNKERIKSFSYDALRNLTTFETYYHILNIIGVRMNNKPDSKIKIIGCNSGFEEEKDNLELSKNRAESVKNYLVKTWDINENRINIATANLPEKPSNINEYDGIEENRRVEITSDNPDIIAPVTINDTIRKVHPSQVRFYNNASTCFKIGKWNLDVFQSGKALIGFRGEGNIPERIIWRLNDATQTIPRRAESIIYKLEISDFNGNKFSSEPDTISVELKTIEEKNFNKEGDIKIDKYSLILFDFDNADLNKSNERILDFINSKILNSSKVLIQGYTDRLGNDDYNLSLSQRRAENTAAKIANSKEIKYEGIGEADLIYNNELPEGRFYCRTVKITVETPILENRK